MAAITITSKKYLKFFFTLVPFISAAISTIHLLNLFDLGNANWLSILLSIAFEIGSISAFLMMSEFKQKHTFLKWFIFLILFFMQIIGNIYYSFEFINISLKENPLFLESFTELANVFIMIFREEPLTTSGSKFLLSCLVGLPVPVISLAFLKARMNLDIINEEENAKNSNTPVIETIVNNTSPKTEEDLLIEKTLNEEEPVQTANIVQVIDDVKEEPQGVITTNASPDNTFLIDMIRRELASKQTSQEKPKLLKKKKVTPKKKKETVVVKTKEPVSEPIVVEEEKVEEQPIEIIPEEEKKEEIKVEPEIVVIPKKEKQQIVNIPEQTLEEKKQEENLLMMTTISTPNITKKVPSKKAANAKKVIVETLDLDEDFKVPHINN